MAIAENRWHTGDAPGIVQAGLYGGDPGAMVFGYGRVARAPTHGP